jgi:hypothetical protein
MNQHEGKEMLTKTASSKTRALLRSIRCSSLADSSSAPTSRPDRLAFHQYAFDEHDHCHRVDTLLLT